MRMLSVCFLLLGAVVSFVGAENGRDFAGRYALSDVLVSNGLVSATLTVRLHNYSGNDIQAARLLLHAGAPMLAVEWQQAGDTEAQRPVELFHALSIPAGP
jgi:hypothetical protein